MMFKMMAGGGVIELDMESNQLCRPGIPYIHRVLSFAA
jgi:hypothetical protein